MVTAEVEHGAPPPNFAELGRTWAEPGGLGEDILLETNPQNRARPQDDVSRASPNSLKLYDILYTIYIIYNIIHSI